MEIVDVVCDGDIVVFAGVEDWELDVGFCDDRFRASEVVGADSQDFRACVGDFRVVFLQLT